VLRPYDIVIVNSGCEDDEIRGRLGYVIGEVQAVQIGVFVYDIERVWCLHPGDVTATGEIDSEARDGPRGPAIRVNSKGEIVG
jgi:hypothetical protein